MTDRTRAGRGRVIALVACLVLFLGGGVAVAWGLTNQAGDPPTPDPSLSVTNTPTDDAATSEPTPTPDATPTTSAPAEAPADDASSTSEPSTTAEPTEAATAPVAPTTTSAPEDTVEALDPSAPTQVDIPAIDVTSPLHPLGLLEDGTLDVPSGDRYDEAAWYDGSVTPGEAGVSVIEGHVTSQGSVPSIFFDLGSLEIGDQVEVTREDGEVVTFEVYALDTFPKDGFPTGRVFGNADNPELRLITCGGAYDEEARAHVDNIVVFAKAVD